MSTYKMMQTTTSMMRSAIAMCGVATVALATGQPVCAQQQQAIRGNDLTARQKNAPAPMGRADTAAQTPTASAAANLRPILMPRPTDTDHPRQVEPDFASEMPNEQATHITVGRSIFIDTRHRLARVYITDPEVLDSYTASPNQVVVTAKKAGASTLILWDESGESKSYLISSDVNVEMLRDSLKQFLPNEDIKAQGSETRVVLSGTVGTTAIADAAVKLASIYSKEISNSLLVNTARVKQVRLEVKIVEVDRSKLSSFGFNFFSAGGQNVATTSTQQFPSTMTVTPATPTTPKTVSVGNPLNFSLYSSKLNIGATLQDLATMQVLQILAEPNISTMSGQKANFLAGGEFPFPVIQNSSTGVPVVSLMFKQYGVKLEFTPVVNTDGTIDLTVSPEVSALDYTNAVSIAGYTIPAISTRRAETQVVLKSGQTFAISGLLDQRTTDLYSRTPGVASVPVLGELFKGKSVTHTNTELVVIVTPTVIDPVAQDIAAAKPPPQSIVPFLDTTKFDKDLPKGATKQ